jgi:hypothetical protein
MRYVFFPLLILVTVLAAHAAHAGGELDSASQDSLFKTKALLNNPVERRKAVEANPAAQSVDQMVRSVGGSEQNNAKIYEISGEVLERLAKETGGDALKMQEIVQKAKDNPKEFYEKYFSAGERAKVQELSRSIGSAPTMAAPPAGAPARK